MNDDRAILARATELSAQGRRFALVTVVGTKGSTPRKAGSGLASYPAPEGSIIAQIETILQRELTLHPDLLDRSIHMGATSDGSLLIEIDHTFYKSPNDVPDPKVHEVVLRAVRTWEKSG